MLLTGHKTRAIFNRYHIVNEQELHVAGEDARDAASERQPIEDACDRHAPEGPRRHNGHSLGGRIVDNRQALHDPPVGRAVEDDVGGPDLVRRL